jgi:predicted methyltransferase
MHTDRHSFSGQERQNPIDQGPLSLNKRRLLLALPLLAIGGLPHRARAQSGNGDLQPLYASVVADPSRSDADRKLDASRNPVAFLAFAGVKPGMRVLDVAAGGGYTTELLARVVGPTGHVFAQVEKAEAPLQQRVAALPNVTLVESGAQDPVPSRSRPLDLITIVLAYHDIAYETVDRNAMDRSFYEALGSDGALIVVDHSAKAGHGTSDAKTLHRIDQQTVMREMQGVGFVLDREGQFLRNPQDPRDLPFFKMQTPTDRFALRFKKP